MSDHQITMVVRDKIPVLAGERYIVCHNEDYELILDLDAEWDAYDTVTVLFHMPRGGGTVTVLSEGRRCAVPACTEQGIMRVGITAGNVLRTSTPAEITVLRSARNDADEEAVTMPPDITQQIIERQDELERKIEGMTPGGGGTGGTDKYVSDYRIETIGFPGREYIVLVYTDGSELKIELPQMGIDIDDVIQFGTSDPTGNTSGATKQLYINTSTGKMWVCKNGLMRPVQWVSLSGGEDTGGGITKEELASAVDDALSEAKESGSFDGKDGKDGVTPHIGANGNWFIGSTDTGVRAKGVDGKDGTNGKDGKTPVAGKDYFTAADKAELVAAVIAGLPVYDGEAVIL